MRTPSEDSSLPWHQLNNPYVRDLAWALYSPALLVSLPNDSAYNEYSLNQQTASTLELQWLMQLDHNPHPLIELLNQRHSTRLGIYFESLWRFYLSTQQSLLAHNLQVNDKHQTLGEMDFLYKTTSSSHPPRHAINHAEAAVKFYLGCPNAYRENTDAALLTDRESTQKVPADWAAWIGPNAKDRLSLKMPHMLNHQLRLTRHPLAKQLMSGLCSEGNNSGLAGIVPELILRGRFFYHFKNRIPAPTGANPRHQQAEWCYITEMEEYVTSKLRGSEELRWVLLERNQWFSILPISSDTEISYSSKTIIENISKPIGGLQPFQHPMLVAILKSTDDGWVEEIRAFIMPQHWPENLS
jgi:uncharacterized protein